MYLHKAAKNLLGKMNIHYLNGKTQKPGERGDEG